MEEVLSSFFRPYIKKSDKQADQDRPTSGSNDTSIDDDSDDCSQTFLWIHQEKWQRDLLVKYGNTKH